MINELAKKVHQIAIEKGFWEEENIPKKLLLIHSEVSEATEADRVNKYSKIGKISDDLNDKDFVRAYDEHVKGTFDEEMVDIIIRVMDLCSYLGIDIDVNIQDKIKYNSLRKYKHGKKY